MENIDMFLKPSCPEVICVSFDTFIVRHSIQALQWCHPSGSFNFTLCVIQRTRERERETDSLCTTKVLCTPIPKREKMVLAEMHNLGWTPVRCLVTHESIPVVRFDSRDAHANVKLFHISLQVIARPAQAVGCCN